MSLVPLFDLPPLDAPPPGSLPSEADLIRLLYGQSPNPCKVKKSKSICLEGGGCQESGDHCLLFKMKNSWTEKGLPLKERDDDIVKVISKVKERLRKVKKNLSKMGEEEKQRHAGSFRGTTVNLGPANIREKITSEWHLPTRIKTSLLKIVEDYLGKKASR